MQLKPEIKLYYILPVLLLVVVIIIILLFPGKKKAPEMMIPTSGPLPTLLPLDTSPDLNLTPKDEPQGPLTFPTITLIPAAPQTGADLDPQIPQEENVLASQKKELRDKTPVRESSFTINFNYTDDVFTVFLSEPKEDSRITFDSWLSVNYPFLPLDRFRFQ